MLGVVFFRSEDPYNRSKFYQRKNVEQVRFSSIVIQTRECFYKRTLSDVCAAENHYMVNRAELCGNQIIVELTLFEEHN